MRWFSKCLTLKKEKVVQWISLRLSALNKLKECILNRASIIQLLVLQKKARTRHRYRLTSSPRHLVRQVKYPKHRKELWEVARISRQRLHRIAIYLLLRCLTPSTRNRIRLKRLNLLINSIRWMHLRQQEGRVDLFFSVKEVKIMKHNWLTPKK
jgi:hypothetical protein